MPCNDIPQAKREKKDKKQILLNRYPLKNPQQSIVDDHSSLDSHMKGLKEELQKKNPRESVLLPLMKSTFQSRRLWIIDEPEPVSVVIAKYPALTRPPIVSYLIMTCIFSVYVYLLTEYMYRLNRNLT